MIKAKIYKMVSPDTIFYLNNRSDLNCQAVGGILYTSSFCLLKR